MIPAVVFPLHDPEGTTFPHLEAISPTLKQIFGEAFVGVTPITYERCSRQVSDLAKDDFFKLFPTPPGLYVGDQFLYLYRQAATMSRPTQILHLCFIDRLAFILQTKHQHQFIEDIQAVKGEHTPIIFSRSQTAWASHPQNYCDIERFATRVGEFLFGKRLDFAWCHLAIQASQLMGIIFQVKNHDLSMLAEIILGIKDDVEMQDVDWLEWEDPYLLSRNAADLKSEQEKSVKETEKRLLYIMPTVQAIMGYAG